MLRDLYIRDFVLVSETEIRFNDGLTALTGETGAGKSIIFDALGLAIGKRAESGFIRSGAEQAEISATFEQLTPEILDWIEDQALERDNTDELILRRVIRSDGRSRAYINGSPTTNQSLQELSALLIDIQGQHAFQRLLRRDEQLRLLDHYADNSRLLKQMGQQYQQWDQLIQQQQQLLQSENERQDRLTLIEFQLQEFESLALDEEEFPQLEAEQRQLSNGEQLLELSHQAHQLLDGEENEFSAIQQLYRSIAQLEILEPLDATIRPIREHLAEATLQTAESANEILQRADQYSLDPQRLEWLNQHLSTLSDLARQPRCPPEPLFSRQQQLQQQRDQLLNSSQALEQLQQQIDNASEQCHQLAEKLHLRRNQAITQLQQEVTQEIRQLGMEQGTLQIILNPLQDQRFRFNGRDEVEFEIQTNPGSPFAPLSKIASGGELSRVSLAIQLTSTHRGQTPTLIFDEVDSGIGGGVAERIGQKLRQLGQTTQILCVTHLPQVASQGHHHFKTEKHQDSLEQETVTRITDLNTEDRISEIARMLGGLEITQQTLAHAREMVSRPTTSL